MTSDQQTDTLGESTASSTSSPGRPDRLNACALPHGHPMREASNILAVDGSRGQVILGMVRRTAQCADLRDGRVGSG